MRSQLVDEGARRIETDRVKVDTGTQLDQPRADEPMLCLYGPRGSLVGPKQLGNEESLLRLQMREQLAIEPSPDRGDLLSVVVFECRNDLLQQLLESLMIGDEVVANLQPGVRHLTRKTQQTPCRMACSVTTLE
jgi:hypothetical protein